MPRLTLKWDVSEIKNLSTVLQEGTSTQTCQEHIKEIIYTISINDTIQHHKPSLKPSEKLSILVALIRLVPNKLKLSYGFCTKA